MVEVVISQNSAEQYDDCGGRDPSLLFVHGVYRVIGSGIDSKYTIKTPIPGMKNRSVGQKNGEGTRKNPDGGVAADFCRTVPGVFRVRVENLPGPCGMFPRIFSLSLPRVIVIKLKMTVLCSWHTAGPHFVSNPVICLRRSGNSAGTDNRKHHEFQEDETRSEESGSGKMEK